MAEPKFVTAPTPPLPPLKFKTPPRKTLDLLPPPPPPGTTGKFVRDVLRLGKVGGAAGIALDLLLDAPPTAKTDLKSVEQFLGYKPTAPITVEKQIDAGDYGGGVAGTVYAVHYGLPFVTGQGFQYWTQAYGAFGQFFIGPITNLIIYVNGVPWNQTEGFFPANPVSIWAKNGSGQSINMLNITRTGGFKLYGLIPQSGTPDGSMPPPLQPAVIASPVSETQAFIEPQPVTPTTPTLPPVPTKRPGEEKKIAPPPLVEPETPQYPDINPTPKTQTNTNTDEISSDSPATKPAADPALGTNPGKTTSFIPGATPAPAITPLPPGTQRTTTYTTPTGTQTETKPFVPPIKAKDQIDYKETENKVEKKEEPIKLPYVPPIPGRAPSEPVTAEINCTTLNNCMSSPSTPVGQANNKLDQLLALLQGADLFQGQAILNKVTDNNNLLKSPVFGLEKIMNFLGTMQTFAQNAWRATRMDKVLNALNTLLILHNAAMLSRNLAGSLGDLLSQGLNNVISLIKNEEFDSININETVGDTVENVLKGMVGEDVYNGVSETFNKYSRILNAAANVMNTVLSSMSGIAEGLELMGQYTGKIGNALKKSGAVLENSYQRMSELFTVKTGRLGAISRILDRGESVETVTSDLVQVTENFREVQQSVDTVNSEIETIREELIERLDDEQDDEDDKKTASQSPSIAISDKNRPSPGE